MPGARPVHTFYMEYPAQPCPQFLCTIRPRETILCRNDSEVAVQIAIDETTLQVIARMPGGTYPDGLAYSPEAHKVYVSDEHGGTDTVLDVVTNTRMTAVQIGGEIGNTQYDEFSHHMFISAQSANQLVEVDPKTDMIVRRIPVTGAKENHGLLIDSASRRAFVACQGNDQLIVIDLRTGAVIAQFPVAKDPDVFLVT